MDDDFLNDFLRMDDDLRDDEYFSQMADDFLRMHDDQIQFSPDNSCGADILKYFDESIDYAVDFGTNPPQDSTQDHPVLPAEPVEDSIPMGGGVPPLPSTGGDELTTNPQPDSAHRRRIILDPIYETFFKGLDESPRSPTCDVLPLQDNLSDSVEASKATPDSTQQHPPPTSQSLEVPVSTSQPLQNVSNQQHVHAQLYQPKPSPLQSPTPPNKRQKLSSKRCGCKASKCRQGYCACYAAGELCGENCSCQGCLNKSEYEAIEKRSDNMRYNPQELYGAPPLNPFAPSPAINIASMAHQQANSFSTSSNISAPPAVQMAVMAQQQANSSTTSSNISPPPAVQTATMFQQQMNSFTTSSNISSPQAVQMAMTAPANPFVPSSNISPPHAVQMAVMAQPQANPYATLSNISPPHAVQMAVMAQPQANPFATSSNISPPHAVQMAVMAQPQTNPYATSSNISPPHAVQMAVMAQPQANISPLHAVQMPVMAQPQANPFATSSNISPPHAVQMAVMVQPQANPYATSSNISPLPAIQMAGMDQSRGNPGTTYQPQQQHMLMNPTNPQQMGHRVFSVNSGSRSPLMPVPPRLRQEANKINMYWKQLPR